MLPDALQALLVLQERDTRRAQMQKVLAQVPRERVAIETRLGQHRAAIEAAKKAVTDLELKRKEVEVGIREIEDQILRYRSQQLQVKKNDEYQALTHEIEQAEARRGQAEEDEIRLLYELDTERARAKETEQRLLAEIAHEHTQLERVAERERQAATELEGAIAEVARAREAVSPALLPRYDRLAKSLGLPVVVPLREHKCGGCHLKVSSSVEVDARKRTEITACDNCTRIIYFEY